MFYIFILYNEIYMYVVSEKPEQIIWYPDKGILMQCIHAYVVLSKRDAQLPSSSVLRASPVFCHILSQICNG